jgi:HD-GYP domain-containing protein (c-di-GMP phosphodiesterase class II)
MEETIEALTITTEMRDSYTAGHQRRVSALACAIAGEMRLPEITIEAIQMWRPLSPSSWTKEA